MFLNNGINKKFYEEMKPQFLFKVLRKDFISTFFEKYGKKICAIKKVADCFIPDGATLMQSYNANQLIEYQNKINIPDEWRFEQEDLKEIYLEFQTIIRNYSRIVFAIDIKTINDIDHTYYYIFDGLQLKWVDAFEYINLFNMENETIHMLDPYRFE